jgi:hypothetical protein
MRRVMRQVRRCFIAAGGEPRSTSQILKWVYPDLDRFKHWHRWSARRALLRYAVPIGLPASFEPGLEGRGARQHSTKPAEATADA